jgi:SRSO17 transposase
MLEVRKWKGWYRHINLFMLALLFWQRNGLVKKEPQTDEPVPPSVPEIRRLLAHRIFREALPWPLI